jgi:DNA polymerase III sliding clamp (beta) subunit (PCNA family)
MLKELLFVQGSVAKKDFQPALTHFHICNGRIQGYNGTIALSSPIALDLDITPKAIPLVKALQGCKDTVALSKTDGGRLAIKSGKFKAFVDCLPEKFPEIHPSGDRVEIPQPILPILKTLRSFVAEDASRQWARGILLKGKSAYATNNIILVEYYLAIAFPFELNIPLTTIDELLRINEEPEYLLVAEKSITFCFSGERWLNSGIYSIQWPNVEKVLVDSTEGSGPLPFTDADLQPLLAFVDKSSHLYFHKGCLATSRDDGVGASVECVGLPEKGVFNLEMLRKLFPIVNTIDFSRYPAPCPFFGNGLRGVIIGMRE